MSPHFDSSNGSASPDMKERRARNRAAQKKHRQKKLETDETRWHRIKHLEGVIERMSTVVVDFTDSLLQQHVVQQNAGLIATIQSAIADILTLANEAGDPIEGSKARKPRGKSAGSNDDTPKDMNIEPRGSLLEMTTTTASHNWIVGPGHRETDIGSLDPIPITNDNSMSASLAASLAEAPTAHVPLATSDSQTNHLTWTIPQELGPVMWSSSLPPLSLNSFIVRLTYTCFDLGCLVLSKSINAPVPLSDEYRIFGSTLRYRERDEMIPRMKWLLGPGMRGLQALAELPWGGRWWDREFSGIELANYATNASMVDSSAPEFLSVVGVEKQLKALGARHVGKGMIELDSSKLAMLSGMRHEPTCVQPDSWSFVNIFPSRTSPVIDTPRVRVSVNALITNLSKIAVCLMKGPGFPKQALRRAIEESIVSDNFDTGRRGGCASWY
ncbi:hypothetical protein F53441_11508 [Fusarium austroafricanum]|uniref:BZIP domain-containing protein n=1 Tax=Fusarium austroafricanum TaxID=2364996 RepID=A0A8H4K650_9HYPO|nr:hypothetical protein F53441_11508 [Fusarium austroafricanum]